jgi:hypothetical protein
MKGCAYDVIGEEPGRRDEERQVERVQPVLPREPAHEQDAVVPNSFGVRTHAYTQLLAHERDPRGEHARLRGPAGERHLDVEEVAVETALARELCERAGVVRREWEPGLR